MQWDVRGGHGVKIHQYLGNIGRGILWSSTTWDKLVCNIAQKGLQEDGGDYGISYVCLMTEIYG